MKKQITLELQEELIQIGLRVAKEKRIDLSKLISNYLLGLKYPSNGEDEIDTLVNGLHYGGSGISPQEQEQLKAEYLSNKHR